MKNKVKLFALPLVAICCLISVAQAEDTPEKQCANSVCDFKWRVFNNAPSPASGRIAALAVDGPIRNTYSASSNFDLAENGNTTKPFHTELLSLQRAGEFGSGEYYTKYGTYWKGFITYMGSYYRLEDAFNRAFVLGTRWCDVFAKDMVAGKAVEVVLEGDQYGLNRVKVQMPGDGGSGSCLFNLTPIDKAEFDKGLTEGWFSN
jgi:hypothetical protein